MMRFNPCGLPSILLGPSASSSNSTTSNYSSQTTLQGGASGSNTLASGGNITTNDPTVLNGIVGVAGDAIKAALSGITTLSANQAQLEAQTTANQSQILSSSIQAQNSLAAAQGTGGASITAKSTNLFIYGAIAVALVGILAFVFAGRRKSA